MEAVIAASRSTDSPYFLFLYVVEPRGRLTSVLHLSPPSTELRPWTPALSLALGVLCIYLGWKKAEKYLSVTICDQYFTSSDYTREIILTPRCRHWKTVIRPYRHLVAD